MYKLHPFTKYLSLLLAAGALQTQAQVNRLRIENDRLIEAVTTTGAWQPQRPLPLVTYQVGDKAYTSTQPAGSLKLVIHDTADFAGDHRLMLTFTNTSRDTLELHNVYPFDSSDAAVYITGRGRHGLSRTHLFLPDRQPVNVIVPDNAWELGYAAIGGKDGRYLAALTRRDAKSIRKGQRRRFETILYPGGSVNYSCYLYDYSGSWQQGLQHAFQEKMLYDVEQFNDSLYQRKDLAWIRHTYILHLMDAWDKFYYDYTDGRYHLQDFLQRGKPWYGGDDIVSIWPTWPTLGLDQRNQFDLFRDLPGGTAAMKAQAEQSRAQGTRFFICYNPWDGSTRQEDHFKGLSNLIAATAADGVVLDTKGESSRELQEAADAVRPGVVMYSEGMAVPRDMAGIVSGRVHNALYYPPMLNLNKFIKPEFAIYRVAELYKEKIRREFATAFFNGYGTELNIMAPGQPDWVEEQYRYLGRTTRILREHAENFTSRGYTPLIPTTRDSIWVNAWAQGNKTIYTIYSILPGGYKGHLFAVQPQAGYHFVDLWHHRLLTPKQQNDRYWIEAQTDAFNASDLGTNNEGAVDCVAQLPILIQAQLDGDVLHLDATAAGATRIKLWAGTPAYDKTPRLLTPGRHTIRISEQFGRFEGDLVVQLMQDSLLLDEQVLTIPPGTARRISITHRTTTATAAPGMVHIPAGRFTFRATHGDEFISYPRQDIDSTFAMGSFLMDQFPVTNGQFREFLEVSGYQPADTANFLKHWTGGAIPKGQEQFPVVYISYEDAQAYAAWAGKRLPSEIEWQYAAQTPALREWPWHQPKPVVRKPEVVNSTLTVTKLEGIDPRHANLGNGQPYKVGSYPKGANPYGLQDLVGCVWQLTNDLYMSGSHRYIMMKGGSYFKPSSSWWYVQGGPRELHYRQFLLRVSQGFERNATVGFRCVKDTD